MTTSVFTRIALTAASCMFLVTASAQQPTPAPAPAPTPNQPSGQDQGDDAADTASDNKMAECLKKCKYLTESRPREAELYFIIKGSPNGDVSCGALKAISHAYKQIQKSKDVEVILVNIDSQLEADDLREWVKDNKVKFPVVNYDLPQDFPFPFKRGNADSYPLMVAVDAKGKRVDQANGSEVGEMVSKWKKVYRKYKVKHARAGKI